MRKIITLILLAWMAGGTALAQTNSSFANLGTSWLKISNSTRNTALGSSAGALPDAFDEADLNPAGLGVMTGTDLSLSQDFWAQDLSMQHLVFSQGNGGDGFSFGINFMNFGSIDTYSVTGAGSAVNATGNYSPIGLNLYGAYGFALTGGLRVGLTAHLIYDDIEQNFPNQTAAFDLGMYYQQPGSRFSISEVLANAGSDIDNSNLPVQIKTAAAYQLVPHGLALTGEADWFLNGFSYTQYGVGLEGWFKNAVALRAGYQFTNYGNLAGLVGLSLGAGIKFADWEVDYAFVSLGDLGITNQIGLNLKLGDVATPTPTKTPKPPPTPTAIPTLPPSAPPPPMMIATPIPTPTPSFMDYYHSGIQRYSMKDYDGALKNLKTAITIYDKSVKHFYYAEAFAMIGVIYKFNRPDPILAHHYCDIALKIDPTTETARKLRYEIDASSTKTEKRYWKGMEASEKRNYTEAIRLLRTVIRAKDKTTPSFFYAEAYKGLGMIYAYYRPNHAKAVKCFKAAIKIEPKDKEALAQLKKLRR